jgi:uncharacterized protein
MDRRSLLILAAGCIVAPTALAQVQGGSDPEAFPLVVARAAEAQVGVTTLYDPAYVKLAYPMGDPPRDRGVCTDVIIRAFRAAGVDLQVEVHRDMSRNFASYPAIWGLSKPDRNIDHRRAPNLETYFRRKGAARDISRRAQDYAIGDIVSWRLSGSGLPHIGVVTTRGSPRAPLIAHNIGAGVKLEPVLFDWPIEGWFRFERWG